MAETGTKNEDRQGEVLVPQIQDASLLERKAVRNPSRGMPKSGRAWKEDLGLPKRASSRNAVSALRSSWKEKQQKRAELEEIRKRSQAAKAEIEAEKEAEKQRIKASRARKEANSLKNVKYQVVSNTAKLKKISKAQWKNYRKLADVNKY